MSVRRHIPVLVLVAMIAAGCAVESTAWIEGSALPSFDSSRFSLLPAVTVAPMPTHTGSVFARQDRPEAMDGQSFSVGTASRGYLVGGAALPTDHASLKVRPVSIKRRAIHGTHAVIEALERAAAAVARKWPGSQLFAGDISAVQGGDIRHHASHNSGRDADLAFYLRDQVGSLADGPDMNVLGRDGQTEAGLVFDEARNWELIASILQNPNVQVQWFFVANHLRGRMLTFAERVGADEKLIQRASVTMRQPGDSSPHADHFHVRFFCGLEERLRGCVDTGERHDWINSYGAEIEVETSRIIALLRGGGGDEKRYVIKRIGQLALASGARHLEPLKEDADPTIRVMAIDTIAFLRGERTPPAWAHLTDEDVGE
jgi:murein endopeptidase